MEGEKFRDSFTVRTLGFGSLSFFFRGIRGKSSRLGGWMEYETRRIEDDRRRKLKKKCFDFLENIIFISLSSRIKIFIPSSIYFSLSSYRSRTRVKIQILAYEKSEIATCIFILEY